MGVVETLKKLDYRPRRTIRVIAWMNEENGGAVARLFRGHKQALGKQYAAIEMDSGAAARSASSPEWGRSRKTVCPLRAALQPMARTRSRAATRWARATCTAWKRAACPVSSRWSTATATSTTHHTPADTLDKVDPDNLKRNVALMSSLAWFLANIDGEIGRAPEQGE